MDITVIYEKMSELHVSEDEMCEFVKGYLMHKDVSGIGCGWILTPCRLVYRQPSTVSMVVMPYFIPALKEQIWGVEANKNGIYLAINGREATVLYDGSIVAEMYGDSSVLWGSYDLSQKRPLGMPRADELHALWAWDDEINATLDVLRKENVSVCRFHGGEYFVKTSPNKPQQAVCSEKFEPYSCGEAYLRYVLHADNERDMFCSVNRFGVPSKGALKKCLSTLGYALPDSLERLL